MWHASCFTVFTSSFTFCKEWLGFILLALATFLHHFQYMVFLKEIMSIHWWIWNAVEPIFFTSEENKQRRIIILTMFTKFFLLLFYIVWSIYTWFILFLFTLIKWGFFLKHVSTVLLTSSILNNTKYKGEFEVCNINKYYFISDFVIKNGTGRDPR